MSVRLSASMRFVLTAAVTAWTIGAASAQARRSHELPDALENIKPAAGICRRDEVVHVASSSRETHEMERDLKCGISAEELKQFVTRPSTQIVDMRLSMDFQRFHIDNALNLGMPDLLAKPYWRDKPVVLVGDGKAELELYRACSRLKQSGYRDVRVLRGGMPMWQASDLPVAGRAPDAIQLIQLSAAELWMESQNPDNLLLIDPELAVIKTELPTAAVLPLSELAAIRAALERRRKERRNAPMDALIWVTAAPLEQMQQVQQSIKPVPLLVYGGGRDNFQRQVSVQQAVWAAQARGPKQPGCGL